MKLGIMQPYFFPYIGYWQLLNAVDQYVIYDDVCYIKGGWINRNRILSNGKVQYFNVPVLGASSNKLINEIQVNNDVRLVAKNIRTLEMAYGKAPFFDNVYPMLVKCLECKKDNLADYIVESMKNVCGYLGIDTELIRSSTINKDNSKKGEEKVLDICNILHANQYYNAIGGKELYHPTDFQKRGVELYFLKMNEIIYSQFKENFVPDLSIIDALMFNSVEKIKDFLNQFELIE